jgi:hypothetical protein
MEDVQQKVTVEQRRRLLWDTLYFSTDVDKNISELLPIIANLVENAYIAGANRVNIGEGEKHLNDTGEIKVLAGCYAKDKGLKL